jgi:hypothetical protein
MKIVWVAWRSAVEKTVVMLMIPVVATEEVMMGVLGMMGIRRPSMPASPCVAFHSSV